MKHKGKRVLIIADTHCGHRVGLTPPKWWDRDDDKFGRIQRELWCAFEGWIAEYRPFDVLIYNGDAIDGKGHLTGGTEQITTNRVEQTKMVKHVLDYIKAPKVRITFGSPYHVGKDEDFEEILGNKDKNIRVESHGYYDIEGVRFDVKHKIAASSIPHGTLTPLAKEILWAQQWHLRHGIPLPDVLIRSHTHRYDQIDHDGVFGIITSSLQGLGSKYGARQCSGTVDFGIQVMDVHQGEITWYKAPKMIGETQIPVPEVL